MATKKKEKPSGPTAIYRDRPDKLTVPVSGAYGGPIGDGQSIAVHLYADWGTVPNVTRYDVVDGNLVEGDSLKQSDITREIQVTLIMPAAVADVVAKLLLDKARIVKEAQKKRKSSGKAKEKKGN